MSPIVINAEPLVIFLERTQMDDASGVFIWYMSRTGDPLPPYIFIVAFEVLIKLLNKAVAEGNPSFHHNWKSKLVNYVIYATRITAIVLASFIFIWTMEFSKVSACMDKKLWSFLSVDV